MDKNARPYSAYPGGLKKYNYIGIHENKEKLKISNFYSKEDLCQQVFILKTKINEVLNENKILKAKIVKLERKKYTSCSPLKSVSIANFKKELEKQKLFTKNSDFERKTLKTTFFEQKKKIEEVTGKPSPEYNKIYKKYLKLCLKIKKLKEQIKELNYGKDSHGVYGKIGSNSENLEKNEEKVKNFGLNTSKIQEIKDVKEKIRKIYEYSCMKKLDFDEIWFVLNPNNQNSINYLEFSRGIHGLGFESSTNFELLFNFISENSKITRELLERALTKYKPSDILSYSDLKVPLQHLIMRLQTQRTTLDTFLSCFRLEPIKNQDFYSVLTSPPYNLDEKMGQNITNLIFSTNPSETKAILSEKLLNLVDP